MFPRSNYPNNNNISISDPLFCSPSPAYTPQFKAQSKVDLRTAVDACLKMSPKGDCFESPHGLIWEWDVSRVTDMSRMFSYATAFNGEISWWDMSQVKDMSATFLSATSFNRDISKWDVSNVITMTGMFRSATSFNADISHWNVSSVTNMDYMFMHATAFKQELCGPTWVNSTASKTDMFTGSSGSSSQTPCMPTILFSSNAELKSAFEVCLKFDLKECDCSKGPDGPIAEWAVSRVTDMSRIFADAKFFNGDLSKWDVSRVTTMSEMFAFAGIFNGDLSKWDVSSVKDMFDLFRWGTGDISKWDVSRVRNMDNMFLHATSFDRELCGSARLRSNKASKKDMFTGSSGSISQTMCTTTSWFSSKEELETTVEACLKLDANGDCSDGPHGPITA